MTNASELSPVEVSEVARVIGEEIEGEATFELGGVPFDLEKMLSRQAELNDLVEHYADNQAGLVGELNTRMERTWDDDFGLSYTHIAGRDLRGLSWHGIAEKVALSGCDLRGVDFTGLDLDSSVFVASVLDGANVRGANLNNVVAPASSWRGADLRNATAVDASFNLGIFDSQTRFRGADFTNAYLLGTEGIDAVAVRSMTSILAARIAPPRTLKDKVKNDTLQKALATRFAEVDTDPEARADIQHAKVISGGSFTNRILGARRMDGMLLHDVLFDGSRLTNSNATGSIWNEVHARRAALAPIWAAGIVISDSVLEEVDARKAWLPGSLLIGTSVRNATFEGGNLGGSVWMDVDAREVDLEDTNLEGVLLVGGRPPELTPAQAENTRVLQLHELPEVVVPALSRFGQQAIGKAGNSSPNELDES